MQCHLHLLRTSSSTVELPFLFFIFFLCSSTAPDLCNLVSWFWRIRTSMFLHSWGVILVSLIWLNNLDKKHHYHLSWTHPYVNRKPRSPDWSTLLLSPSFFFKFNFEMMFGHDKWKCSVVTKAGIIMKNRLHRKIPPAFHNDPCVCD